MFVLFHAIFELVKISILACVYGGVALLVFYVLGQFNRNGWFFKVSKDKFKFWFTSMCSISVALFLFMFTYWGDHGLGDNSRIPIGYGQAIHNGDGSWTYFYSDPNKDYQQFFIGNYVIADHKLCAKGPTDDRISSAFKYIVYDLESRKHITFNSEQEYSNYAESNNLPSENKFLDFKEHYDKYWNGRRFWLLP